jgi:predicted ester cyclase
MDSNEEIVRRWLAAGDEGEVSAFDECLHPDVVVHAPLGLSTKGVEAEKEVWRRAKAAIPDIRHEIQETVSAGLTIAVRTVVTGTAMGEFAGIVASGQSFRIDQAVFAHLRDGKIVEAWEIADAGALLQQLGMSAG